MTGLRNVIAALLFCTAIGSCVPATPIGPDVLARYQERLINQAEQRRLGTRGQDLLRPAPVERPVELDIEYVEEPQATRPGRCIVRLSLDQAIRLAIQNSLDIAVAAYEPQVSREQIIEAAGEFDVAMFAGFTYSKDDIQPASIFGGGQTNTRTWEAGLTQKTITGATWTAGWTLTRTWDNSAFVTLTTQYEPVLSLEISQPLLRDAWPQYNLANLSLARVNHRVSTAEFRRKVEETVTKVITSYWSLYRARREVQIQENLLKETEDTLRRIKARGDLDATAVQIKQAESAVSSRRASLIRAEKTLADTQDALVRLLSDERINLLTDCQIIPTTEPVSRPVEYDETDQLLTALQYNPLLVQAREGIAAADIQVRAAWNQQLPRLDLTASGSLEGLAGAAHQAHENMGSLDYASYSIGIRLEYPLGNRVLRSRLRQAKLRRLQAITDLQNTADLIAQQVRERIRQVRATYKQYQAQEKSAQAARAELQALKDTEQLRGALTPEFLQVKLSAQELIARAESAAVEALVAYNAAMVQLQQTVGTVLELNRVRLAMSEFSQDETCVSKK